MQLVSNRNMVFDILGRNVSKGILILQMFVSGFCEKDCSMNYTIFCSFSFKNLVVFDLAF